MNELVTDYTLCVLAKAAYQNNSDAALCMAQSVDDRIHTATLIDSGDSDQAYLFEAAEYMVLAFRGTDEWKDWLDNFGLSKLYMGAHSGFWMAFINLMNAGGLFERLSFPMSRNKPLFITGHSLGGGMAICAAYWFILQLNKDNPLYSADLRRVVTFGAPRTGNRHFRDYIETSAVPVKRYFHNNDVVPNCIPAIAFYVHVGEPMYINRNGKIKRSGLLARLVDRACGIVAALWARKDNPFGRHVDIIADHEIDEYLKALRK